jgi:hypothetical protein
MCAAEAIVLKKSVFTEHRSFAEARVRRLVKDAGGTSLSSRFSTSGPGKPSYDEFSLDKTA